MSCHGTGHGYRNKKSVHCRPQWCIGYYIQFYGIFVNAIVLSRKSHNFQVSIWQDWSKPKVKVIRSHASSNPLIVSFWTNFMKMNYYLCKTNIVLIVKLFDLSCVSLFFIHHYHIGSRAILFSVSCLHGFWAYLSPYCARWSGSMSITDRPLQPRDLQRQRGWQGTLHQILA